MAMTEGPTNNANVRDCDRIALPNIELPDVDCAFWCDCGTPISQDPEIGCLERAAGMCIFCLGQALR